MCGVCMCASTRGCARCSARTLQHERQAEEDGDDGVDHERGGELHVVRARGVMNVVAGRPDDDDGQSQLRGTVGSYQ